MPCCSGPPDKQKVNDMIIANLRYIVPIETIDQFLVEHRRVLQELCDQNILVCSGPKNPRDGGIMMLNVADIDTAKRILSADPFWREELATYEFIEFTPVKCAAGFASFLPPSPRS